jgi:hypothetical protein
VSELVPAIFSAMCCAASGDMIGQRRQSTTVMWRWPAGSFETALPIALNS